MSVRSCGHDNDGDNGLTQEYKLMRIAWLVTCSDSPRRRPIWQASTVSLCLSRFAHHQMLKRIVFLHHQHVSTKCIYPGISGALVSTKAWALDTTRAWALVSTRAWAWALCPRKERPQPTTKRRTVIKLAESGSSLVLLPANFLNGRAL